MELCVFSNKLFDIACNSVIMKMYFISFREMLDRVLVKRLRDSDSESDEEKQRSSTKLKTSSTDKPTDILAPDNHTEVQVTVSASSFIISHFLTTIFKIIDLSDGVINCGKVGDQGSESQFKALYSFIYFNASQKC